MLVLGTGRCLLVFGMVMGPRWVCRCTRLVASSLLAADCRVPVVDVAGMERA